MILVDVRPMPCRQRPCPSRRLCSKLQREPSSAVSAVVAMSGRKPMHAEAHTLARVSWHEKAARWRKWHFEVIWSDLG